MACTRLSRSETALEPRGALWEGVELAVRENTKFKIFAIQKGKLEAARVWNIDYIYIQIETRRLGPVVPRVTSR